MKINDIPVVAAGASAGGLEAFKNLLGALPADTGIAFVLIQHLDPAHESLVAELLGRCTPMKVVQVNRAMRIKPNHVFVIPPNKYLAIKGGVLKLTAPSERRGMRAPFDFFLRCLAADRKEKAICVVLSGTGSDGSLGLRAIKGAGGMVMAQEPEDAGHDGMPRSAIKTGLVDFVVSADKMADALIGYVRHPYINGDLAAEAVEAQEPGHLKAILASLKARTGYDFSCYKKSTLRRRIERRMGLKQLRQPQAYIELLRDSPDEAELLFKDLLIGVTGFFRESKAFKVIKEQVIPQLLDRQADATVRVWVPGCATGEEAYSFAMLLIEAVSAARKSLGIQIFATDIDEEALDVARTGIYPDSIANDVPPPLLDRFFTRGGDFFQVTKQVRETVTFAKQSLIADPPFSRLDLVSCRNLLIYLEPEIQGKIIALFHFALVDGGFLFLGNAETVGRTTDLFEPVSKTWRVYRRIGVGRRTQVDFPIVAGEGGHRSDRISSKNIPGAMDIRTLCRQILLSELIPAAVVVSNSFRILYFHGSTGNFLEPPTGEPTSDLLEMVRYGLRSRVRTALYGALRGKRRVNVTGARVMRDGRYHRVRFCVIPVAMPRAAEDALLVTFEDDPLPMASDDLPIEPDGQETVVRQLENELQVTREDLQTTIEQLETSNEELKTANEEIMSANEELQSTNEELETSKEELQSLNEELSTLNTQLQEKVSELDATSNDLSNLLSSTEIATIFMDTQLRVRRFTGAATSLLNLIPTDIGRPISDITGFVRGEDLLDDARLVLDDLAVKEREISTADSRRFIRRCLPYRTHDNTIEGVVFTFFEITALKHAERIAEESRQYAESIVETVHAPLLVLDGELRVISVSRSFYEVFQVESERVEGMFLADLGKSQWDNPDLHRLLEEVSHEGGAFDGFEVEHDFPSIGHRVMHLNARRLRPETKNLVLLAIEDVTDRKRAEAERRRQHDDVIKEIHHRVKNNLQVVESLLNLQARHSHHEEVAQALENSCARIHNMALVHEKLCRTGDIHRIGFAAFLSELINHLRSSYGVDPARIQHKEDFEETISLEIDQATPCAQLITELVTNALRHAFPDGASGTVEVSSRRVGGSLSIVVSDDGIGIPEASKRGSTETLGLRLAHALAGQLAGQLDISDRPTGGTSARLTFDVD